MELVEVGHGIPAAGARHRPYRRSAEMFERLENRRLLANVFVDGNGVITVDGEDTLGESISLIFNGTQFEVDVDGDVDLIDPNGVTGALINGGGGNDSITLGSSIAATTCNGGDGDDTISG